MDLGVDQVRTLPPARIPAELLNPPEKRLDNGRAYRTGGFRTNNAEQQRQRAIQRSSTQREQWRATLAANPSPDLADAATLPRGADLRGKPAPRAERPRFSEPALQAGSNPTAAPGLGAASYKHTRAAAEKRGSAALARAAFVSPFTVNLGSVKFDTAESPSSEHQPAAPQSAVLDAFKAPDDAVVYDDSDAPPSGNLAKQLNLNEQAVLRWRNTSASSVGGGSAARSLDVGSIMSGEFETAEMELDDTLADDSRRTDRRDHLRGDHGYDELLDAHSLHQFLIFNARCVEASPEFASFQRTYAEHWPVLRAAIADLEGILARHAVTLAVVDGGLLAAAVLETLSSGASAPAARPNEGVLCACLANLSDLPHALAALATAQTSTVSAFDVSPDREGDGVSFSMRRAAICIQAVARRFLTRRAVARARLARKQSIRIQATWRSSIARVAVRRKLTRTRRRSSRVWEELSEQLHAMPAAAFEPFSRANAMSSQARVEIHIPSLSIDEHLRLGARQFVTLQTLQMGRCAAAANPAVHVVYVSAVAIPEDVLEYHCRLLDAGADPHARGVASRITVVVPEHIDTYPRHFALSSLVLYSPACMRRLAQLIKGQPAYIVPQRVGWQEKAIACAIGCPLLAPEPDVAQLYSTRSGAKRVFVAADVNVPVGAHDIYDEEDFVIALTKLIASHLEVRRWLLKIDADFANMGVAYLDVAALPIVDELRAEWRKLARLHGDPHGTVWHHPDVQLLARAKLLKVLKPALPSLVTVCDGSARPGATASGGAYASWSTFAAQMLRIGGVIEAEPPVVAGYPCAHLLVRPDGITEVRACHDVLTDARYRRLGASFPSALVPPAALEGAGRVIGNALALRGVIGHATVHFTAFEVPAVAGDPAAPSGKAVRLWATDLELGLSTFACNHQLLAAAVGTANGDGGDDVTLASATSGLTEGSTVTMPPAPLLVREPYVQIDKLYHPNLGAMQYASFFKLCRLHGISFDLGVRQGTLFILVDSIASGSLGTITIGPTLPDALQAMLNVFDFFKKHLGGRTALVPPEGLEDFVALEQILGRALAVWKQAGFVPQVF